MRGGLRVDMEQVYALLYSLENGDLIEVHWEDASKNYNVRKITNPVVACHKKWSGRFITTFCEQAYGIEYLVMESIDELDDLGKPVILCVPIPVITYVLRIENKMRKVTSDAGQIFLGGGKVKTIERVGGVGQRIE